MNTASVIERAFRALLPAPFTIAVLLTLLTMLLAWLFTGSESTAIERAIGIVALWEGGLWNPPLLVFAIQMMLMLVLGHILALSAPAERVISLATRYCNGTATSAALVTLLTVLVSLFNWGLGLVFGAIFARKVGERASRHGIPLNYPLIGAAGYSGMMVWHGGISGSAPIKAAEHGHIHQLLEPFLQASDIERLPEAVTLSATVFSNMNIMCTLLLVVLLPILMFLLGKRTSRPFPLPIPISGRPVDRMDPTIGAERLDHARWFTVLLGTGIVAWSIYSATEQFTSIGLGFITPNFINLLLLGLALGMHRNINSFLGGLDSAIGGASGILIQFPLYFGIMGIMGGSGLARQLSDFFVSISTVSTFPFFTMISASIVNVFVPSGGGQWGIQGPIVLKAALELGADIPKSIMALAYGDQLTNMLQPFWALPLLGITGLKAKEILPYTLVIMAVGTLIFTIALQLF
ncbi:MAG: TIGR00366 family protein [Flavobacteriales bacterium]|nr:TIGR00366 family protein [Flavobacteriales bacterium]